MDPEQLRKVNALLEELKQLAPNAQISVEQLSKAMELSNTNFSSTATTVGNTNRQIQQTNDVAQSTASSVTKLGISLMNTGSQYTAFNRYSYEAGATMSEQFKKVTELGSGLSNLFGMATQNKAASMAGLFKINTEQLSVMLTKVDDMRRLENGIISTAASAGNLGDVFRLAGKDMSNMPAIIEAQGRSMIDTQKATGLARDQVQSLYASIASIPGGLEKVESVGVKGMSSLTAAIKLADGMGRNATEVIQMMGSAYDTYGLRGEDALKFTAAIGKAAEQNNIQFDKMKSVVASVSSSLRGYADTGESASRMAQGSVEIINQYVGALHKTGMTAEDAAGLIGNMTSTVANLNIAQKAFLSAQTGGPGGLMGAFQIEKLLDAGKIEEVFAKVQQQLKQQIGPIVSLEEAGTSEAAARQMQRQMMMLQSGPLGQLVKSDKDARRVLEAMRTGGDVTKAIGPDTLKESVERGTTREEPMVNLLGDLNSMIADADLKSGMLAMKALYSVLAPNARSKNALTKEQQEYIENTQTRRRDAETASGAGAQVFQDALKRGDTSALNTTLQEQQDLSSIFTQALSSMKDLPSNIKKAFKAKTTDQQRQSIQSGEILQDISATNLDAAQQQSLKKQVASLQDELKQLSAGNEAEFLTMLQQRNVNDIVENALAEEGQAQGVKTAAQRSVTRTVSATEAAGSAEAAARYYRESGKSANPEVNLTVKAICVKCTQELENHQLRTGGGAGYNI